jgi:hypothetical protein
MTRTDAAVSGHDEDLKNTMRRHQRDLILRLPPRRVWLYLRQSRVIFRLDSKYHSGRLDLRRLIVADSSGGPEDGLITGKLHP